jgi:hypothetical protein
MLVCEVFGNFVCGTDNPLNAPLLACSEWTLVSVFNENVFLLLGIPIALLLYPITLQQVKALFEGIYLKTRYG